MRPLRDGLDHAMYKPEAKKVVYYPGCFANYWDPQLGRTVVHILEKNGFQVIVPKHHCCGIARVGYGDFKGARKEATMLVDELFILGEQGYDIITACPSCALALKEEYLFLLNNEKVKLVAERTHFLSQYLNELHEKGELNTDFKRMPLSVAYHTPCHLKAQGLGEESIKLMTLIPGLQVIDLDRGCCGMSGTTGLKHRYYESSMSIGRALAERIKEVSAQVVTTDCGACKMQIEQAANVEVTHPAIILDNAYLD